jgi:hypothetical protein
MLISFHTSSEHGRVGKGVLAISFGVVFLVSARGFGEDELSFITPALPSSFISYGYLFKNFNQLLNGAD